MNRMTVSLGFRRRGTRTWVDIDSSTPEGRRLLALFSHPKEIVMTTAAGRVNTRPVSGTTITDPETGDRWSAKDGVFVPVAGTGIIARVRGWFRGLWNSIKSGWARLKEALHLDAVTSRVKRAWSWLRFKARQGMSLLGTGGGAGLAMLGISTSTGRQVLGFLLTPVRWAAKGVGTAYVWLEEIIDNGGKGGPRQWIADRMSDFREFLFGNGRKAGVVEKSILWVAKTFGRHLLVDSLAMRSVRSIGSGLVLSRLFTLMLWRFPAMLGFPFMRAILDAIVAASVVAPFAPEIKKGYNGVSSTFRKNTDKTEEIVDETAAMMHQTTAAAAAMSAGNEVPNRAERRNAAKKTAPARPRR